MRRAWLFARAWFDIAAAVVSVTRAGWARRREYRFDADDAD